jgi:hypothetical protein
MTRRPHIVVNPDSQTQAPTDDEGTPKLPNLDLHPPRADSAHVSWPPPSGSGEKLGAAESAPPSAPAMTERAGPSGSSSDPFAKILVHGIEGLSQDQASTISSLLSKLVDDT